MNVLKIFVNGVFRAGKSEFIRRISESLPETAGDETVAGIEFGRIMADADTVIYLFAFSDMNSYKLLREGIFKVQGMIIFTDSTMPEWSSIPETHNHLHTAKEFNLPCVVAANKQDSPGALSPDEIRNRLQIPEDIAVLPCIATQRESVKSVLLALLKRMPPDEIISKAIANLETL